MATEMLFDVVLFLSNSVGGCVRMMIFLAVVGGG